MIQDIFPRRFDIGFKRQQPGDTGYVLAMQGGKVLLLSGEPHPTLPRFAELSLSYPEIAGSATYLFSIDSDDFYCVHQTLPEISNYSYHDTQAFRTLQPGWLAFAGITACHLMAWYGRNRFCGACATPMTFKDTERALSCGACGLTVYPGISPAVIVGVVDQDKLLMTRYANRPYRRMALVAGFMEVGETLEDTVRREVLEEVGVRVKNIRYYKNQPWGFSNSLLVGFFADLDGPADITLDTNELQEAFWVPREEIPADDINISLTSEMVDAFRRNAFPS